MTRRWDAELLVGGERFAATVPANDTLDATSRAAVSDARALADGDATAEVRIELFKTTAARGREYDRSIWVGYDGPQLVAVRN